MCTQDGESQKPTLTENAHIEWASIWIFQNTWRNVILRQSVNKISLDGKFYRTFW